MHELGQIPIHQDNKYCPDIVRVQHCERLSLGCLGWIHYDYLWLHFIPNPSSLC